ncbi:metallophosphoesterase family protein [Desulfonema magnum]|uniref:Metallophosphoesterase family protein n=1 Tax=Desulfonema magnum TaxID=45655 RepID=A0A975BJB9_9BACT|nr:metallophosphoesterase family protein [Desulfonema magnum]QTA86491.1 Metallophosphoesterase family protein [Desulfonema magnum]
MKNIFAIGDIHGTFDKLVALMEKIEVQIDFDNDLLVFMGDYIDRGPRSFEVVEYLINLKKQCQNIIFLKGNHEDMLEKYLSGPDKYTYLVNGGQQTLESYLEQSKPGAPPIPSDHLDFFGSLVLFYETDDYIFVHAGLRENLPLQMQSPDDMLWIRTEFIQSDYDFGKRVIFGHTPFAEPFVTPTKIGIDTGAVYGNDLTCVKLPALEFYSV